MKRMVGFKKLFVLFFVVSFLFVSCEKGDNAITEEIAVGESIPVLEAETIFSKSYNKNLSKEAAEELWRKDVNVINQTNTLKAYSTEWYFDVATKTGPQKYNDTDDYVYCQVNILTDIGYLALSKFRLNNPENDFEKGDWNFFRIRSSSYNRAVQWIKIENATLSLVGNDGWFVTNFNVTLEPTQTIPSTGRSYLYTTPNIWLDNDNSSASNSFWSLSDDDENQGKGSGRLTF